MKGNWHLHFFLSFSLLEKKTEYFSTISLPTQAKHSERGMPQSKKYCRPDSTYV